MIRATTTIIGTYDNPNEVLVTLFPVTHNRAKTNPQLFRTGNKSTASQQRYNRKMSETKMIDLIMNNFTGTDILVTLTYYKEPSSIDEADKELSNYLNKLQKFYKRKDIPLSYVAVTEQGDKGHRIHHHVLIKLLSGMDYKDIIGRWSRRKIGRLGYVSIESINSNPSSADDMDDVFSVAKYITKNPLSPSNKRFRHTEGLLQPIKFSSDDLFSYAEYEAICDNPDSNTAAAMLINKLCPHQNYVMVDRHAIVNWIEQAGYFHLSARLRRQLCTGSDLSKIRYKKTTLF